MPLYPPIVLAMRHVHKAKRLFLQSLDWATTWDCSGPQSGEMLGNSTSQRERRARAERLPGGSASDPSECKICRGHGVSIGQELNQTDTEQQ